MDVSGCAALFSDYDLQRVLDGNTFNALDRLRTEDELSKV